MTDYQQFISSKRRLEILRWLSQQHEPTAHDQAIKDHLGKSALACSMDIVRSDLQWLYEQQCLAIKKIDTVWLATLAQRGDDVANGLSQVPGVARPD